MEKLLIVVKQSFTINEISNYYVHLNYKSGLQALSCI